MRVVAAALLLAACTPTAAPAVTIRTTPPPTNTSTTTVVAVTTTTAPGRTTTTHASRSRVRPAAPTAPTGGVQVSSTAYCETGRMANGQHTYIGAVAANRWPIGTRLHVTDSPNGPGIVVVADRIGSGSELDFSIPGDCAAALRWGRRTVTVEVVG